MSNLRILLTGEYCGADIQWHISPLPPVEDEPADDLLQDIVDIANADACAEEWAEYRMEQEWLDHGL